MDGFTSGNGSVKDKLIESIIYLMIRIDLSLVENTDNKNRNNIYIILMIESH